MLITVFLALHTIGSHYTYSAVPWFQPDDGAGRNHYDRLIHFLFGLCLTVPVRELFLRTAKSKPFWRFFAPLSIIVAASVLYEFLEWGMMLLTDKDAGMAFLGAQGDIWDGHKDMGLATVGALIASAAAPWLAPLTPASTPR